MATTNDDWETLRAIYDDGEDDCAFGVDDTQENSQTTNDERKLKLVSSSLPNGCFCGTVHMTLSTSKIAFARLVKSDGSYRYFALAKPPILKLDLLYFTRKSTISSSEENTSLKNDHDDWSELDSEGPYNLRLTWDYYPSEWPTRDKEKYRSSLAKKCQTILQEEGSFSVCQFLEHDAISFYYEDSASDTTADTDDAADDADESGFEPTTNASNSWKTYVDPHHPGYLLVILPPKMDQLYYSSIGTLVHPREEAAALQKLAAEKKAAAGKQNLKTASKTPIPHIATTLDFGRHALLQNWKDLYMTRCPICLEESMLYSDGAVLPYCQHYCCRDCFTMYLSFKVQDIKQHRTNPFLCPVESCKRELPMGYCKQFLSDEDIEAAKAWYKDLKNPPAWSLDRCLRTKTCGAVGSMRRRKGVESIDGTPKDSTSRSSSSSLSSAATALESLVYCESCETTWCELCLVRVYDDFQCKPVRRNKKQLSQKEKAREDHTISNHRHNCRPGSILQFCRRYMAASKDIKEACEAKYPWIASYSHFCGHDGAAILYILENGQRCPNCSNGVERIEGCFHMKCPTCATHFCYECGAELFYPFYGTHHCWEENEEEEDDNGDDVDEQLAMMMQFMDWAPGAPG